MRKELMRKLRFRKVFVAGAALAALLTAAAGCAGADVVLKYSPGSFDAVVAAFPSIVTGPAQESPYYSLTVDGTATLKVSDDYALSGQEDIVLETALKPFTDKGLDPAKLGAGYRVEGDKLLLVADYGAGTGKKDAVGPALFESAKADRKVLTYHEALDHYGIKLPAGKFEFAKNYKTNDKDIVFVIAAKPLADIGVDIKNIEGWTFLTMQEPDGAAVDVLLKPYDLK